MQYLCKYICTLDSGIIRGQGIYVGPGRFVKKKKRRFLNKYLHIAQKSTFPLSNKAVKPGKNPKLINIGPTSIPESRVRI
jgi:hypothetical protein